MNNKPILLSEILRYNCYFFDFDGVILESSNIKTEAFLEIYSGSGFEEKIKAYHLANQGISRFVKFRWIAVHFFQKEISDEEVNILGNRFSEIVFEKILKAPFVLGMEQLLKNLKNENKHLVIASGTPQEELELIITKRKIVHYFQEIYGAPSQKKDIVAQVMKRKNFTPKGCLFFGDASTDYEAAKANNIHFFTRYTHELESYWKENISEFVAMDFASIS